MNSYHDFLKYELDNFEGDFPKFVKYIPEFFKLLCDLLEEDIEKEMKRKINSALAYFVIPNDVISEEIYGPAGYIDDIFACCVVLKEFEEKYGVDMIKQHWDYDEDFDHVLGVCYNESKKELEEKELVNEVLEAACLD
jgi:uncharacterized membrane protein YkvA (DUF1232 family)